MTRADLRKPELNSNCTWLESNNMTRVTQNNLTSADAGGRAQLAELHVGWAALSERGRGHLGDAHGAGAVGVAGLRAHHLAHVHAVQRGQKLGLFQRGAHGAPGRGRHVPRVAQVVIDLAGNQG